MQRDIIWDWYSRGVRHYLPHQRFCNDDSDCSSGDVCANGFCKGIHRRFDTHGLYYSDMYKHLIKSNDPLAHINYIKLGDGRLRKNHPHTVYDLIQPTHNYNYDYDYE